MADQTRMNHNSVLYTDGPAHQPFKICQNLHPTKIYVLTTVGLSQRFPKKTERLHMSGTMPGNRKD